MSTPLLTPLRVSGVGTKSNVLASQLNFVFVTPNISLLTSLKVNKNKVELLWGWQKLKQTFGLLSFCYPITSVQMSGVSQLKSVSQVFINSKKMLKWQTESLLDVVAWHLTPLTFLWNVRGVRSNLCRRGYASLGVTKAELLLPHNIKFVRC